MSQFALNEMLNDLNLVAVEDVDGDPLPSSWSITTAKQMLIRIFAEGWSIPSGGVSSDSHGGVRMEWVGATANVHLCIPSEDHPVKFYTYWNDGNSSGLDKHPTAKMVAERIATLLHLNT